MVPGLQLLLQGKVRDTYELDDKIVIITTDRQSAFDRLLASIPFKGQVLNQTAAWWFSNTQHIIPNAVLDVPDPNITVMKKCTVFPVEFVVRGFMTGNDVKAVGSQPAPLHNSSRGLEVLSESPTDAVAAATAG